MRGPGYDKAAPSSPMNLYRLLASALIPLHLALPGAAFTQEEMLALYQARAQPIPQRHHACYRDGIFLQAQPCPTPPTPPEHRLPDDAPIRPEDEFLLRVSCIAADGSRMGELELRVKADGSLLAVHHSTRPGDYQRLEPFAFRHKKNGTRIRWSFEGGTFQRIQYDYGRQYVSEVSYDAQGNMSVSIIPSLAAGNTPPPLQPPSLELEEEFTPPAPPVDLSEAETIPGP